MVKIWTRILATDGCVARNIYFYIVSVSKQTTLDPHSSEIPENYTHKLSIVSTARHFSAYPDRITNPIQNYEREEASSQSEQEIVTDPSSYSWGTLQCSWWGHYPTSRKVRIRFPMKSLDFSIYLKLPAALWP
jgi:hypothetical protein